MQDMLTSSQTWALETPEAHRTLLYGLLDRLYAGVWPRYADVEEEWSGPGVYRLQVRVNRPEGRPLYSLKWEGV